MKSSKYNICFFLCENYLSILSPPVKFKICKAELKTFIEITNSIILLEVWCIGGENFSNLYTDNTIYLPIYLQLIHFTHFIFKLYYLIITT